MAPNNDVSYHPNRSVALADLASVTNILSVPVQLVPKARNLPSTKRHNRTSKPKVRSGCLTCKTRRVKCDEAKPACARCIRGDFVCDGYEKPPSNKNANEPAPLLWMPVQTHARHHVPLAPPMIPGLGSQSVPYLDAFRYHIAPDLSGSFYMDFCEETILIGAHQDTSIRQLVLALGALTLAIADDARDMEQEIVHARPSSLRPWGPTSIKNKNHAASLKHYLKAVQILRKRLQTDPGRVSIRTMLIITILMALYEILQGNLKSVDGMLRSVTNLVHENHISPTQAEIDGITSIQHTFTCFSLMSQYSRKFTSPWPIFMHMKTVSAIKPPVLGLDEPKALLARWRLFNSAAMAYIGQAHGIAMSYNPALIASFKHHGHALRSQAQMWEKVIKAHLTSKVESEYTQHLRMLKIHCIITQIQFECCLDSSDMLYDAYGPTFASLLDETVVWLKQEVRNGLPRHIILGEGILLPLLAIARLCRIHDVRMDALHIVQRISWQEGAWDPQFLALGELGTAMMEEQERQADGVVPARSRWVWVSDVDRESESATPHGLYFCRALDENGQPIVRSVPYMSEWWQETCRTASCTKDHSRLAKEVFEDCQEKKQIRQGTSTE
ncbi:hypothetical protein NW752_009062 [Fusarium irregulare]|uniref:Zn(2)-C6 fungal-type domain-containing protein n=1 Tax=Fusarium irregulare TaxID=2494466 RepID=A0A9W8PJP4_9HYPO|nr:hypothetical protein NW766_008589 [Fusarium irregulare]KAJ4009888.1 hypothetical protein NW752_009062 [Fusarium irregulare]